MSRSSIVGGDGACVPLGMPNLTFFSGGGGAGVFSAVAAGFSLQEEGQGVELSCRCLFACMCMFANAHWAALPRGE